jgi:hypothetical protein
LHLQSLISEGEAKANADAITSYSPFKTVDSLLQMFDRIKKTGTTIVIFNLRMEEGKLEFNFEEEKK